MVNNSLIFIPFNHTNDDEATVRGVDLFPPPTEWVPPNCHIEVDDLLLNWTWREPFDLIHLRFMIASWTPEEWEKIYTQCYE